MLGAWLEKHWAAPLGMSTLGVALARLLLAELECWKQCDTGGSINRAIYDIVTITMNKAMCHRKEASGARPIGGKRGSGDKQNKIQETAPKTQLSEA